MACTDAVRTCPWRQPSRVAADTDIWRTGPDFHVIVKRGFARSAAIPVGREKRSVKPSAQPTMVRIHHLPPPAETARGQRKYGCGRQFHLSGHVRPRPALYG